MHQTNLLDLFWEGFQLKEHQILNVQQLLIHLESTRPPRCSGCNTVVFSVHDTHRSRVRERDLFDHRVWLEVPVRRVSCPRCGVWIEQIDWLDGRRHMTLAMRCHVEVMVLFAETIATGNTIWDGHYGLW